MTQNKEAGFSLIELLLVLTCLSIIAVISINYFMKAKDAAENTSAIATLSLMRQNEAVHFSQRDRFGRLDELNVLHGNLGTVQSDLTIRKGPYRFDLTTSSGTPTASDPKNLKFEYLITATRTRDNQIPYVYTMDQTGVITKVLPVEGNIGN